MKSLKKFFLTTLLGGLVVILPVALIVFLFSWLYRIVSGTIAPITDAINRKQPMDPFVVDLVVIILIVLFCFLIGVLVKTKMGGYALRQFEINVLEQIPFYKTIRETINQFTDRKKSPFRKIALVDVYGNDTLMTGFITDEYPNGYYTVFVPTGPNPTNGMIYHLKKEQVKVVDVAVDNAIRSVISCGSGSGMMFGYDEKGFLEKNLDEETED